MYVTGYLSSTGNNVFVEKCWTPSPPNQTNPFSKKLGGCVYGKKLAEWDLCMDSVVVIYSPLQWGLSCLLTEKRWTESWPLLSSSWFTFSLKKKKKVRGMFSCRHPPPTYTFKARMQALGTLIQPLAIVKHLWCCGMCFICVCLHLKIWPCKGTLSRLLSVLWFSGPHPWGFVKLNIG